MTVITEDRLLDGRVRLRQPRDGYRAAIDPVLLAAAAPAAAGQRLLDIGCGVGAAALCVAARVPEAELIGLELQPALAALAQENAALNGAAFRVVVGDVRRPPFAPASFDHVIANPPFLERGTFTPSANASALRANAESEATLGDWIGIAAAVLRPKGSLTLIHRADRVDDVLSALHRRFGSVVLIPLWPAARRDAKRILVQARKGGRAPARLTAGLVLHREDGQFTAEADAALRDGQPLSFLRT
jgi:tRNA1(Val) A37 N6-methylase TrmN6